MLLKVNGKEHNHNGNGSIAALLAEMDSIPERVAVLVNDEIIPSDRRAAVSLKDNDRVEIIVMAGGG